MGRTFFLTFSELVALREIPITSQPLAISMICVLQKYAISLSQQLDPKSKTINLGSSLDKSDLDLFSQEQLVQLYELYQEATKAPDVEGQSPTKG